MAQRVITSLVDDLDESEATGTVPFALDGKAFEIDLNDRNQAELRDALAKYVASARIVGKASVGGARRTAATTSGPKPSSNATAGDRERSTAARKWLTENGHEVAPRGRIPNDKAALVPANVTNDPAGYLAQFN